MPQITNIMESSASVQTELNALNVLIAQLMGSGGVTTYSHGGRSRTGIGLAEAIDLRRDAQARLMRAKANENNESALFMRGRPSGCGNS